MANGEVNVAVKANAEEAMKAFKEVKEEFEKVSEGAGILSKLIEGDFSGALEKATSATKLFGAASEAAFAPLAILSFIKTLVDAGNALGDFISNTFIFTEEDKKADAQLRETNKTLAILAEQTRQATRARELFNAASASEKDKLQLKYLAEDGGSAAQAKKKLDDTRAEIEKLKVAAKETKDEFFTDNMGNEGILPRQTKNAREAEERLKSLQDTLSFLEAQFKKAVPTEGLLQDKKDKDTAAEAAEAQARKERERAQAAAAFQQAQQQQMQAFQQGLQKKKDAVDAFHAMSKADEAAYWADILKNQKLAGENRRQVEQNYIAADKAAKLQSLHDEVESVREKVAAVKAGSQERVTILDAELKKLEAEGKKDTEDYKRLQQERAKAVTDVAKAEEEANKKRLQLQKDIEKIELAESQEHTRAKHDLVLQEADFELQTGKITAEQRQQISRKALDQEYADQSKAVKDQMALLVLEGKTTTTEYANLHKQLTKIDDDYHKNSTKLTQQWILKQRQQYQQYFNQFNQQFNTALNGMINGTETASQAFGKMFQSMLQQLIQFVEAWIEKKVEMWIMDKLVDDDGSQTQVDNTAKSNAAMALSDASLAAANAYAPLAWDPLEAGLAATAAFTAVSAMSVAAGAVSAAKFEKGGIVPQTGLILAHQGETILPASMSGTGAGLPTPGAQLHVHFNMSAVDGESAARFIKGQSRNIASVIYKELKKKGMNG